MSRSFGLPKIQFSLVWLFAAVTAAAICALVARQCGWVEAVGVGLAFVLTAVAIRLRGVPYSTVIRRAAGILAALIVWGVGVDWSVYIERCERCHSDWVVQEYRLFGRAVWSKRHDDPNDAMRLIAEDLGTPCPHDLSRWHKWRLWGLIVPARPFHNGITGLTGPRWYDNQMREIVRSRGRQRPELGIEFRDRVLINHDYVYWRKFCADLQAVASAPAAASTTTAPQTPRLPQAADAESGDELR
jgi:hypothetical protein